MYKETARLFKALCDENRIKILELLRDGERCGCNLLDEIHLTQPTLSHHMKILVDSNLVKSRKEGKWTHYSLSSEGLETARKYLEHLSEK